MPTKDELMDENAALKAKVAELTEQLGAAAGGSASEAQFENGLYVYNEGLGFSAAVIGDDAKVGLFLYDGDEATRIPLEDGEVYMVDIEREDGEFFKVDIDPDETYMFEYGSGFTAVEGGASPGAPAVGAMTDRITMLESDLMAAQVQRDEARNEVARLKDQLKNAGTLHGHVDKLKAPY